MHIDMADLMKQVAEDEWKELEAYEQGKGDAPIIFRQFAGAVEKADSEGPISFTLSHESEDRMGDIIHQDGWDLNAFKKNPVMLWAHDGRMPPIGKWAKVRVEGKALVGEGIFDSEDPFAQSIEAKVRRGFINAVSVGFKPKEFKRRETESDSLFGSFEFLKQELIETSVVPIPAHPKALRRALAELDDTRIWSMVPVEGRDDFLLVPAKAMKPGEPELEPVELRMGDITSGTEGTQTITVIGVDPDATPLEDRLGKAVDRFAAAVERLDEVLTTKAVTAEAVGIEPTSVESKEPEGSDTDDTNRAQRDEIAAFMDDLLGETKHAE